jgi:predicted porin
MMKKSLIALAVLAASGAAMAQSSVNLYGRLDASLFQKKTEVTGKADVKQTGIDSSNLNTTFWGLKGTEDLGGGLKANFKLESGFAIDTGSATGTLFERQAIVGLSGAFGAVDLGRNYTAYDALRGATNNMYDSNLATTADVWNTGIKDYSNRTSNSVIYNSPSFGGFSGAVAYAFGENKNTTVAAVGTTPAYVIGDALNTASLHIKYANGPVLVGYAYQEEKTASATGQDKNKYNLVGASYDFGVAKLVGSYNQAKNNTLKDKEFQVGVSVPFGAAAVAAGYSRSKSEGLNANNKGTGFSMVGTYNLSKRTTAYAGFETAKVETVNGSIETKTSNVAAGIRHTF